MDIQVRYTGSVEQFQNLCAKKSPSSLLFLISYEICKEKVLIYRDKTKIQKSKGNELQGLAMLRHKDKEKKFAKMSVQRIAFCDILLQLK